MLRASLPWLKAKTLQQMFRKLKLAGAHPDILWGIDAQKAQHNGEEMIRLETLMHKRETTMHGGRQQQQQQQRGNNAAENFIFWLRANSPDASAGATLKAVQCTITPYSQPSIVKRQLSALFEGAGILEDFELSTSEGADMSLGSVLLYAEERHTEHVLQAGSLYIRGDKAVENLRRFGVLLVVEENGTCYLVTLPEMLPGAGSSAASSLLVSSTSRGGSSDSAAYRPAKSIIGPNGEIDPDVQSFMSERGMRAFDLRMAGSHSSVERFVTAFERLERMYESHRGRALRSSVCLVLSLKSSDNYVAPDGCIVLAVQRMPAWEEFLLSLPQDVWTDCVKKHLDWRIGNAPKLRERQRQLHRVANMFHFCRVMTEAPIGGELFWQDEFINKVLKDEAAVRRAISKYHLTSDLLKRRGEIVICDGLYSALHVKDGEEKKEIGFRIGGDGKIFFNQRIMSTGQMLRVLKDNIKRVESFQKQHDNVIASLEHVSRNVPVDFSVDTEWKYREEGNLVNCLERFARMIKQNEMQLGAFMRSSSSGGGGGAARLPAGMPVKARMVWIISDKFDTMPSGVVFVPHDVDFESIKRNLLGRG